MKSLYFTYKPTTNDTLYFGTHCVVWTVSNKAHLIITKAKTKLYPLKK